MAEQRMFSRKIYLLREERTFDKRPSVMLRLHWFDTITVDIFLARK